MIFVFLVILFLLQPTKKEPSAPQILICKAGGSKVLNNQEKAKAPPTSSLHKRFVKCLDIFLGSVLRIARCAGVVVGGIYEEV